MKQNIINYNIKTPKLDRHNNNFREEHRTANMRLCARRRTHLAILALCMAARHKAFTVSWHVMTNLSLMKISVFGLLLRMTIIAIVIFSMYGLLIQFIFSYFNQSINGPELTVLNFAGPLLLTVFILVLAGLTLLFKKISISKISSNSIIMTAMTILLLALMVWQIWYIVTLYNMKAGLDFNGKFIELIPMTMGLLATSFFMINTFKRKHAS